MAPYHEDLKLNNPQTFQEIRSTWRLPVHRGPRALPLLHMPLLALDGTSVHRRRSRLSWEAWESWNLSRIRHGCSRSSTTVFEVLFIVSDCRAAAADEKVQLNGKFEEVEWGDWKKNFDWMRLKCDEKSKLVDFAWKFSK